ncbi:MAG: portal protein [Devosia sp.]|nr:portal protein [Devosia sp.]
MTSAAKARYTALVTVRQPFLDRARDASTLTIPSLVPPEGHNSAARLPEPNQGLGARLVVHLASYFTSALLPPGRQTIFRLGVSPEVLLKSGKQVVPPDVESSLSLVERIPHTEIERRGWRAPTNTALQHLLVAGNVMEHMLPDNTLVTYPLDRYVVVRDPAGKLIEFLIEDALDAAALEPKLQALVVAQDPVPGTKTICLYTWGKLVNGEWEVHQEIEDSEVPDSRGKYKPNVLPYFALRWSMVAGEDYGRGKAEEHIADLRTFDGLSKAIRDGAAMASRNITMIRPNASAGINLRRKIASANNGDFIVGNPEDVSMLQFQNTPGLQVVQAELAALKQELGAAFMLTSSVIRNAERVTADEVRRVSQELDSVQGGAYSLLSSDMMRPRVDRLIWQMKAKGQMPNWPEGVIEPTILTGLEAMGREADTSNVVNGLGMLKGYPPETYDYINWPVLLKKGFTSLDLADAVRSDPEVAQLRQERMNQQTIQNATTAAAGPVAQAAASAATQ